MTPRDKALLDRLEKGASFAEAAAEVGISRERVRQIAKKRGDERHQFSVRLARRRVESRCGSCGELFVHFPGRARTYCSAACRDLAYARLSATPTSHETAMWEAVSKRRLAGETWASIMRDLGKTALPTCQHYRDKVGGDGYPVFWPRRRPETVE